MKLGAALGADAVFDHVGMAVHSIRELTGPDISIVDDPIQRVSVAFADFSGLRVELIQRFGPNSPIDRNLEAGQVLVHLCYRVPSLDRALACARQSGLHPLTRPAPAVAFGGRRIVWLFNKSLGLIELLEDPAIEVDPA